MKTSAIPWLSYWRSGKICNQPRMMSIHRSPFLPTHFLNSYTTVCANPLYWLLCRKKLRTSSLAPFFSTSQTASNAVIPTASTHNYSSTLHHNSALSHLRVISLHAHSVAAAMHSFLYNISHTPKERSPHALPCNSNGETAVEKKETTNKTNLNPKIRKCSHWCGDLISCYTKSTIFSKMLSHCFCNITLYLS
jgi:hypothetical protein